MNIAMVLWETVLNKLFFFFLISQGKGGKKFVLDEPN